MNLLCTPKIKTIQVTWVDGKEKEKSQNNYPDINDEEDLDVLARITLDGSVMYGLNSMNQMFERFTTKTYAISIQFSNEFGDGNESNEDFFWRFWIHWCWIYWYKIHSADIKSIEAMSNAEEEFSEDNKFSEDAEFNEGDEFLKGNGFLIYEYTDDYLNENSPLQGYEDTYVICKQLKTSIKVTSDMLIPIIRKGALELVEEEINNSFTIFSRLKDLHVYICKCTIY